MKGQILNYKGMTPKIGADCYLAPGSFVIGDVHLGDRASVWFNAVIRGDVHHISIGEGTNVQDQAVIHAAYQRFPTIIGKNVTIGHSAIIHACTIEDLCLLGMGCIILDGAKISKWSVVAAGAVVPPNKTFPEGSMIMGSPAKVVRPLTEMEKADMERSALHYCGLAKNYM